MRTLLKYTSFALSIFLTIPLHAQGVEEILNRMMERNLWQDRTLVEFRVLRKFYAANERFRTDSTMFVETVFRRPDRLESMVTRQEGSAFIRSRVFDKILEAEAETRSRKDKQRVDIIPANYTFSLQGTEQCEGRPCFHLRISPKRRDKYSITGDVWVDGEDYSIVRIHGAPAKRPSIWTLKTEIDRRYRKIAGIWLPDRMESSSNIMIAGHSVLSIQYFYDSVKTEQ
jgi:hypothetical protein